MLKKLLISIFIMSLLCLQAAQEQLINTTPEVIKTESGWNTYRTNIEQKYTCCSCSNKITSFYYVGCVHDNIPLLCIDCKQACLSEEQKSTCVSMFGHSDQNVEDIEKDFKQALFQTAKSCSLNSLLTIVQESYPNVVNKDITTSEYVTGLTDEDGNTLLMKALQSSHDKCKKNETEENSQYDPVLTEYVKPVKDTCSSTFLSYVQYLIEHSSPAQLMHQNKPLFGEGLTPFLLALRNGHKEVAELLIDVNVRDRISLLLSSSKNDENVGTGVIESEKAEKEQLDLEIMYQGIEVAKEIETYRFDKKIQNKIKDILSNSASKLYNPLVSILSNNVRKQAQSIYKRISKIGWPSFESPFLKGLKKAVESKDIDSISLYIDCGVNLNQTYGKYEFLPLIWACENGALKIAELLLKAGADANVSNETYVKTPLWLACKNGDIAMVKLLIKYKACLYYYTQGSTDWHKINGISVGFNQMPLTGAVKANNLELIQLLLEQKFLLANGQEIQYISKDDQIIALEEAMRKEKAVDIVKLIVSKSTYDLKDIALVKAAMWKNKDDLVDFLISEKANPNIYDQDGNNVLSNLMLLNKCEKFTELLQSGQVQINNQNKNGETLLMQACKVVRNNHVYVKILLEAGADINIKNKEGETALDIAQKKLKSIEIDSLIYCLDDLIEAINYLKVQSTKKRCLNAFLKTTSFLYDIYLKSYGLSCFDR